MSSCVIVCVVVVGGGGDGCGGVEETSGIFCIVWFCGDCFVFYLLICLKKVTTLFFFFVRNARTHAFT